MTDFQKKLPLYKTAYSPVWGTYVGIKKVREDENGRPILDCTIAGRPEEIVMFRVDELTNYCL